MAPPDTAAEIFLNGSPSDWVIRASGISSIIVAPLVVLTIVLLRACGLPLRWWIWILCALPAAAALAQFVFELQRIEEEKGQAWSKDWNFNELYAYAYARLYLGTACTVLLLILAAAGRYIRYLRNPNNPAQTTSA